MDLSGQESFSAVCCNLKRWNSENDVDKMTRIQQELLSSFALHCTTLSRKILFIIWLNDCRPQMRKIACSSIFCQQAALTAPHSRCWLLRKNSTDFIVNTALDPAALLWICLLEVAAWLSWVKGHSHITEMWTCTNHSYGGLFLLI